MDQICCVIVDNDERSREAQGNILAIYDRHKDTVRLTEWDLYGSKRIGSVDTTMVMKKPTVGYGSLDSLQTYYLEGQKQYELDNHLGNVMVTVSDKKIPVDTTSFGYAQYYLPLIISAQDYYPFGMIEPGRSYWLTNDSLYRFGFNGKEHIDEIYGAYDAYDYGMRFYDPRLGRPLSVDPLAKKFPYLSPYQFFSDNPIMNIDLDGMEGINAQNTEAQTAVDNLLTVSGASSTSNNYSEKNPIGVYATQDIYGVQKSGSRYTSSIGGGKPGTPLSFGDWKKQAEKSLNNDKIDVNWSRKQWKQAYSTYQALASDKTVEVEVVQAAASSQAMFGSGSQQQGTRIVSGPIQTQNPSRAQFIQNAKSHGQATQDDVSTLMNSPSTNKGTGWIYLNNTNEQNETGYKTQGDIIINGTSGASNSLSNALQSLYPK